jgi:hypothetical protein
MNKFIEKVVSLYYSGMLLQEAINTVQKEIEIDMKETERFYKDLTLIFRKWGRLSWR